MNEDPVPLESLYVPKPGQEQAPYNGKVCFVCKGPWPYHGDVLFNVPLCPNHWEDVEKRVAEALRVAQEQHRTERRWMLFWSIVWAAAWLLVWGLLR